MMSQFIPSHCDSQTKRKGTSEQEKSHESKQRHEKCFLCPLDYNPIDNSNGFLTSLFLIELDHA